MIIERARSYLRCCFRFRLSTLLAALSVVAAILALWSGSAHRQQFAIEAIRGNGGLVGYDVWDDSDRAGTIQQIKRWIHKTASLQLIDKLAYHYWCSVVICTGPDDFAVKPPELNGDVILLHCRDLPKLHTVSVSNSNATDAGISYLRGHPSIEQLELSNCKGITDASASIFSHIRKLKILSLQNTRISSASVPALAKLTSLRLLDLAYTDMTQEDVNILRSALFSTEIIDSLGRRHHGVKAP